MTERLTQRNEYGVIGTPHPMFLQDAIDKLAHYEDLEEQSRLLVLPKGFDTNKFISFIAYAYCVSIFGLKDICENENASHEDCKECWEKALKGE